MIRNALSGLVAAVLAGCGGAAAQPSSSSPAPATATTASQQVATVTATRARTAPSGPPSIAVRTAPGYGKLLVDGAGKTLYVFTADHGQTSACGAACAAAWPPLIVHRTPRAGAGVRGGRLSTVRRSGGQLQLAYYGHPLYYYIGDRQAGQILCQDVEEFGGHWWLVKPNGQQNRSVP